MAEFSDIILEEQNQMLETYREFQERQSWLPKNRRATSGRWFNKQKRVEELWNKSTPAKPKKTPQSKRHMYPPPKTKKSLRPTSAQINSYFDKKEKKQTPRGTKPLLKPFDAAVKKRLEREKKLADSSAKISSRRVQSPSLKAELAKKENAKKIASQRKNLKIQQDKKKIRNLRQMGNL